MGYASKATAKGLKHRFSYIFESNAYYPAMVELNIFSSHKQKIGPATISTIEQPHGPITSSGIIIEHKGRKCVYAVDFSEVTPAMVQAYHGADLLIVDALREAQHPTHAHLDMALTMARKVQAKHAILTHLDKSMDYERISAFLPSNVEMGYDGMIMPW